MKPFDSERTVFKFRFDPIEKFGVGLSFLKAIFKFTFVILLGGSSWSTEAAAKDKPELVLRDSWKESVSGYNSIYQCFPGMERAKFTEFILNSPLPTSIALPMVNIDVNFSAERSQQIADDCKRRNSDPFEQVGCISRLINNYFNHEKFDGLNTWCRSHAYAFNMTFDKLKIPRSNSTTMIASGSMNTENGCEDVSHALNRVTFTTENGQPYSYAIDSSAFPGQAFPLSAMTVNYHLLNKSFPSLISSACRRGVNEIPQVNRLKDLLVYLFGSDLSPKSN